MFACVCHAVTDDDVRRHVADGVCTAKQLRSACGMRPGCGSCVRRICDLLAHSDAEAGAAGGPASVSQTVAV